MPVTLLEALRSIPDHRRAEGKRFDLATVLLYAVLGMVAGANSYRQMHEFIRIPLQRLNEAFGLRLPYSPSRTGLRLIILGVDRQGCSTLSTEGHCEHGFDACDRGGEAVLRDCFGLIAAQDVGGPASHSGEDIRIFSDARGILAERDVARVMGCVLDAPVVADGAGGGFCVDRAIGQIYRGFVRLLPQAGGGLVGADRSLDPNDGGDMGLPLRVFDGGPGVEHGNRAGFMAVALFRVDGLDARQRLAGGAGGFRFPTQGRLIVFELNDQVRLGGVGGLESFF